MKDNRKKRILNKHFWKSLFIFISTLLLVWAFTTFINEAVKHDKTFLNVKKHIDNNQ